MLSCLIYQKYSENEKREFNSFKKTYISNVKMDETSTC